MKHDAIRHLLGAYLDGAVKPREKAIIEKHLETCTQCREEITDISKIIRLARNLEDVESPAWLTQKIMGKVRADNEQKRGMLRKLFYPLHFKLPIEIAAVAFLAVTAFYINQSIHLGTTLVETPQLETKAQNVLPKKAVGNRGPENPVEVMKKTEGRPPLIASNGSSARSSQSRLEQSSSYSKLASEPLRSGSGLTSGNGAVPLPSIGNEREKHSFPSSGVNRDALGADRVSSSGTQQKQPTPMIEAIPPDERGEKSIRITLSVKDSAAARNEIEKALRNLGGKMIKHEYAGNTDVLVAEIDSYQLKSLLEKVRALGKVDEKVNTADSREGKRDIEIYIQNEELQEEK